MEATMFALTASCANLGSAISEYSGAFLLEAFGVTPRGAPQETSAFDNLVYVSLVSSLMWLVPTALLPLIPNVRQTDELEVPDRQSAVAGSLLDSWRKRRSAPD